MIVIGELPVLLCCRFKMESSLWGPYLSEVNGEQARQSDRRYWHLSSDGTVLSQGKETHTHTYIIM